MTTLSASWFNWGKTLTRGSLYSEKSQQGITFQFNPTQIVDRKANQWLSRGYTGRPFTETIWIRGDGREITFDLTLDATLGSKGFGNGTFSTTSLNAINDAIKGADELGTLRQIQVLQAFQYPASNTFLAPKFVNNGIQITSEQFTPPSQVVFSYGPMILYGRIVDMTINHELFSRTLAPIRSTLQIRFSVDEGLIVDSYVNTEGLIADSFGSDLLVA